MSLYSNCERKLKQILDYYEVNDDPLENQYLLGGSSGILALLVTCYRHGYIQNTDKIERLVDHLISDKAIMSTSVLSVGYSGIYWLFNYMLKIGMIEEQEFKNLPFKILAEHGLELLKSGNYDFLHGALGPLYVLLYDDRHHGILKSLFEEIAVALADKFRFPEEGMIQEFDFSKGKNLNGKINMGLSHGIPSVLKFFLECYERNIQKIEAKRLAYVIIEYIERRVNDEYSESLFPYYFTDNDQGVGGSRLAWCYGDLSIGYILYQAGRKFNDNHLTSFALKILYHTTNRREVKSTEVYDAGICHGSAGVVHIYSRMWHYTKEQKFKDASDYWMQKTLEFACHEDGIAGFKKYSPASETWTSDPGLLEGTAGIGLVLMSYLTGDFDWDYCLMLNN